MPMAEQTPQLSSITNVTQPDNIQTDTHKAQVNAEGAQSLNDNKLLSQIASQSVDPKTGQLDYFKYQGAVASNAQISGTTKIKALEEAQPQAKQQVFADALKNANGNLPNYFKYLAQKAPAYLSDGLNFVKDNKDYFDNLGVMKTKEMNDTAERILQAPTDEDKLAIYNKDQIAHYMVYNRTDAEKDMPFAKNSQDVVNWANQHKSALTPEEQAKFIKSDRLALLKSKYPWISTDEAANNAHVQQLADELHTQGALNDKDYAYQSSLIKNGDWYNAIQELDKFASKPGQAAATQKAKQPIQIFNKALDFVSRQTSGNSPAGVQEKKLGAGLHAYELVSHAPEGLNKALYSELIGSVATQLGAGAGATNSQREDLMVDNFGMQFGEYMQYLKNEPQETVDPSIVQQMEDIIIRQGKVSEAIRDKEIKSAAGVYEDFMDPEQFKELQDGATKGKLSFYKTLGEDKNSDSMYNDIVSGAKEPQSEIFTGGSAKEDPAIKEKLAKEKANNEAAEKAKARKAGKKIHKVWNETTGKWDVK